MKTTRKYFTLLLLLVLSCATAWSQSIATYTISFTGTWNNAEHGPLPGNDHWSDLVGANHNSNVTFVEIGQLATTGIKNVAEEGANTAFNNEVDAAITSGNAQQWLQQAFESPNIATSTATLQNIDVSSDFPLLSLASMIAPSPDWFVAVNSLNLMDMGGNWKASINMDMFAYDAGTDGGVTYTSADAPITPVPISNLHTGPPSSPFFNSPKVGTLTITLESVLGTEEIGSIERIKLFPNPTRGILNISNNADNPLESVEIYTVLGSKVRSYNSFNPRNPISLNLRSLSSGIYIVKIINSEGASSTRKVVIE